MQNLARCEYDPEVDDIIERELFCADVHCDHGAVTTFEVKTIVAANLEPFRLSRAWTYWVVKGNVPMDVARLLYGHPMGHRTVRVQGHCGAPDPEEYCHGNVVTLYHIDTLAGLCLFVRTVRAAGLA